MNRLSRVLGYFPSTEELKKAQLIEQVRSEFSLPICKLKQLQVHFLEQMAMGLAAKAHTTPLQMLPSFVLKKETRDVSGDFVALDLGGTNFRVVQMTLQEGKLTSSHGAKFKIPIDLMNGPGATAENLFDFLAMSIKRVLSKSRTTSLQGTPIQIGFTFSFPIEQSAIASGRLSRWTKGFATTGVEGEDVCGLLQAAMQRQDMRDVTVVALCNDTVGTLVAEYFNDSNCSVGMILGTGFNACYWEDVSQIPKLDDNKTLSKTDRMCINMESGSFDSHPHGQNVLPLNSFDERVDAMSIRPGGHLLEKQISGLYLSRIVLQVLQHYIRHGIINHIPGIENQSAFQGAELSAVLADDTADLSSVARLFRDLYGISHGYLSLDQRLLIKETCYLVLQRSARLAAMSIATIVYKLGSWDNCTVAVDGSLYLHSPFYKDIIADTIKELFHADGMTSNITLRSSTDGSGVGAGLIAGLASKAARKS